VSGYLGLFFIILIRVYDHFYNVKFDMVFGFHQLWGASGDVQLSISSGVGVCVTACNISPALALFIEKRNLLIID
jgi:hypothetical protein